MIGMLPLCELCKYHAEAEQLMDGKVRCTVYPDGIPAVFTAAQKHHTRHYAGDGGVTFEVEPGMEDLYKRYREVEDIK